MHAEPDLSTQTGALLQLVNCGLSPETINALGERGITSLFPIQKHVYDPAAGGRDLIGRAKTGSGKTLAFALPVIEKLLAVGPTLTYPQAASLCRCSLMHPMKIDGSTSCSSKPATSLLFRLPGG